MSQILETDRLVLREFLISDAGNMWELNSDPEVLKFTGDAPFKSIKSAEKFLAAYPDYKRNGYGRWAVIKKSTDEFIGWCGLKLNEENLVDIGFRFFKRDWNNGYATESSRACIEFGFKKLKLEEIIARADIGNRSSIRVLEKINMKYWKLGSCSGIKDAVYYRIST